MRSHTALIVGTVLAVAVARDAGATSTRGYAVDALDLPQNSSQATSYAIDLDGDGSAENQFGVVLSIFAGNLGLDVAGSTNAAVASGEIVHLVELRSRDAAFTDDTAAGATWYVGEATQAPPLFDGSDTFRWDPSFFGAAFVAPLASHVFVSPNPATSSEPDEVTLRIRIGDQTIPLFLQGTRLKFTTTPAGLTLGQVNGSIRKEDIDNVFVPQLTVALNGIVQADPESDLATTLLGIFDKSPTDGQISVAEVAGNDLIVTLLQPDVDIRDANGNYAPNPAGTSADALSFGFGFTAVGSVTILPRIFDDGFE